MFTFHLVHFKKAVKHRYQMEKRNIIDTVFLIIMGIISFCKSDENLEWKVEKKILNYGEEVTLSCQIDNCCQKSAGWGKWTPDNEFTTIFIDVKILQKEDNSKYYGGTNKKGFFLVIRNTTRDDLNIDYSCTYGFQVSKKKKLFETDVFTEREYDVNTKESTQGKEKPTSLDSEIRVAVTVLKVAVAIVLAGIAIKVLQLGISCFNQPDSKASIPSHANHNKIPETDSLLSETEQRRRNSVAWSVN